MGCRPSLAPMLALALAACAGGEPPEGEAAEAGDPTLIEVADAGFATPESVLHDAVADVYLVSNIAGSPLDKDGNGFISRLTPDGEVEALRWIDGAVDGVTVHAPKGMAILGDTLYVADIDCVRRFVRTTGTPAGDICFPGATFLNDVAVDENDVLYVTDSGFQAGAGGALEPSGSAAVWRFDRAGRQARLLEGESLGGPNGIAFGPRGGFVATFGSGEIFQIGLEGNRRTVLPGAPQRQLDGIVFTADGGFLFSSWGDRSVHRVGADGRTSRVLEDVEAPADIGYDAARNRVLVPLFMANRVLIKDLPAAAPAGGGGG